MALSTLEQYATKEKRKNLRQELLYIRSRVFRSEPFSVDSIFVSDTSAKAMIQLAIVAHGEGHKLNWLVLWSIKYF